MGHVKASHPRHSIPGIPFHVVHIFIEPVRKVLQAFYSVPGHRQVRMRNLTDVAFQGSQERRLEVSGEIPNQVFKIAVDAAKGLRPEHFTVIKNSHLRNQ
jgi:hypothetical protein